MTVRALTGPEPGIPGGVVALTPDTWVTSGRAVVLAGDDHLVLIDPGDEPCGSEQQPEGPLADLLRLSAGTGKPLRWILVTHAHPDHVENLQRFRALGPVRVLAHRSSPVAADVRVDRRREFDFGGGITAIPAPGHSPWGDDLAFWTETRRILFPGDVVQPKGDTWEQVFYPSPFVFFTDGARYRSTLETLAALPLEMLVTGHREVRRGDAARGWLEVTLRSIRAIEEAVARWSGPPDLSVAAPRIYGELAKARGIPEGVIRQRFTATGGQPSAFERFDLPGIRYFWGQRFPASQA